MFKDGHRGRRHSKLKADARGTDTKLQQMDEGLNWFNKEVEDIKLRKKFLEDAKEDLRTYEAALCRSLQS